MKERVARAREARFPGLKTAKKNTKKTPKKKSRLRAKKKAEKNKEKLSRLRAKKKITCLAQRR